MTDIVAGVDRHDWNRVLDVFSQNVTTDYSSPWGGTRTQRTAEELVAGWSVCLPEFDSTHHMVTNHTVTSISDDTATAEADFTATHRIDDSHWTPGGRNTYELVQAADRWRVTALTMTALWESDDRGPVALAAERAAAD